MSLHSAAAALKRNPALAVTLFIPLLSVLVAATLLTFSIGAQRSASAALQVDPALPPLSKTSWRKAPQIPGSERLLQDPASAPIESTLPQKDELQ